MPSIYCNIAIAAFAKVAVNHWSWALMSDNEMAMICKYQNHMHILPSNAFEIYVFLYMTRKMHFIKKERSCNTKPEKIKKKSCQKTMLVCNTSQWCSGAFQNCRRHLYFVWLFTIVILSN